MAKRTVDGVEIAYEVHGTSGDPVVLVHGSLVDRHTWDLVVPPIAASMEVVTYDRRGYGESATVAAPHAVRDDVADLAGLLESINIFPAHIVAHSYAGAVALRLAIDRPEMVRSLTIHEPPFLGLLAEDPASATEGNRLLSGTRELQRLVRAGKLALAAELLVGEFSTEPGAWSRLPPDARRAFTHSIVRWAEEFDDPEAVLPDRTACRELMVPVLLTHGSRSPRFLSRINRALEGLLQNSQVLELPDVGHVPQLVRPHQYVGILLTFLLERNVPVS
ncbi:MAG: alpha/beta hydrolase [Thermoplasmata archaeon]